MFLSSVRFSFHPITLPSSSLKVLPLFNMSQPTVTFTYLSPQYEEVWGMDNQDFYDGSAELVHVVKPLGIFLSLTSC